MEPRIVSLEAMTVVGMEYIGKNENMEIPALWGRFIPRGGEIAHKTSPEAALGVCGEMRPDGSFSYVAGYQVDRVDAAPEGMVVKQIPAATYAVFTHHGPLSGVEHDLGATLTAIYRDWLPQSGYQRADTQDFERYDERFAVNQADSEMDIYVPVKR